MQNILLDMGTVQFQTGMNAHLALKPIELYKLTRHISVFT